MVRSRESDISKAFEMDDIFTCSGDIAALSGGVQEQKRGYYLPVSEFSFVS